MKRPEKTAGLSREAGASADLKFPRAVEADFCLGASRVSELPSAKDFEIAIVGRSNVGKSSFINRICNKRKLARTSATPGRTQQAIVFSVQVAREASVIEAVTLVDLPGYGYAHVSKSQHAELGALVNSFLTEREGTSLVCILNDARRDPDESELSVQAAAAEDSVPYFVVLTKCDKLTRSELAKRRNAIANLYRLEPADILVSGDNIPVQEFWERVLLLKDAAVSS